MINPKCTKRVWTKLRCAITIIYDFYNSLKVDVKTKIKHDDLEMIIQLNLKTSNFVILIEE